MIRKLVRLLRDIQRHEFGLDPQTDHEFGEFCQSRDFAAVERKAILINYLVLKDCDCVRD